MVIVDRLIAPTIATVTNLALLNRLFDQQSIQQRRFNNHVLFIVFVSHLGTKVKMLLLI